MYISRSSVNALTIQLTTIHSSIKLHYTALGFWHFTTLKESVLFQWWPHLLKIKIQHYLLFHVTYTLLSSHWCLFPSGFLNKILYIILISPMCAIFSANLTLLDLIILKLFSEQYRLCISPLCNIIQLVTSSNLGQSILPNTLFSNTLFCEGYYFQDVAPCSLGITSQKIVLLIVTILKTSNLVLKYALPLVRGAKFTLIQNYQ
jgi:hypothetical protein